MNKMFDQYIEREKLRKNTKRWKETATIKNYIKAKKKQ